MIDLRQGIVELNKTLIENGVLLMPINATRSNSMPLQVRELTEEEVRKLEKTAGGERTRLAQEYKETLSQIALGKYIEVTVPEGEKRMTVKNRLSRAAEELGVQLSFRRTGAENLIFQVVKQEQMDLGDVPTNGT